MGWVTLSLRSQVLDGVPCKSVGKGARHQAIDCKESPVPSSPALLPKLPKPAVVRAEQEVLAQISPTNMGLGLPDAGKRKMNVETMPGRLIEDMMNAPAGESSELDTGVKVSIVNPFAAFGMEGKCRSLSAATAADFCFQALNHLMPGDSKDAASE